ncbi:transglycosylase domain-containing protein [Frankia nepalensis]|uniref:transglycosylase domain-containing protein n=1 Tax=Frankia nepalensis TaxID=1836974 RepID=UPI0027DE928F|nr:transglycosylase domain-containing protein [Frankia nepalensis]
MTPPEGQQRGYDGRTADRAGRPDTMGRPAWSDHPDGPDRPARPMTERPERPPAGERPATGRGPRPGTAGRPPTDRPSYHPRATANRTGGDTRRGAASATSTMAVGDRGRGISDSGRRPMHPAERDALYDTVDQAALSKIELQDRDEEATTYRRVGVDGTGGTGARRAAGTGGRHATGPDGRRGPTGPNRPGAAAANGTAKPGRRLGTRGPKWWRARPLWLRRLVVFGFLSFGLLMVAGMATIYAATKVPLPENIKTDQASLIYYADGNSEVARFNSDIDRYDVPLAKISKDLQHAVLAAENKNFYNEPGISYRGIARALWVNVKGGEIAQGGSTITQQYVKNAFLTQDRTFTRKMKEVVMAVKLDKKYSKDQILEFYLNTIYFGRGVNGIEAAAQAYFGKHAADLNAAESAVIAGLIRNPNNLDPVKNPDDAKRRWNEVIDTMIAQDWLKERPAYPENVLPTKPSANSTAQEEYIKQQVLKELEAQGITEDQINTGGLRIITTIDKNAQDQAVAAVNQVLQGPLAQHPDVRPGLVALRPGTGEVLAWYGGPLYGKDPATGQERYLDNVSDAKIMSGSTFKVITLAAALEQGVSLKSTFASPRRVELENPGGDTYVVNNDEGEPDEVSQDLIKATAMSTNTVYVPLGKQIGIDNVEEMAKRLGITSEIKPGLAGMTLGHDTLRPVEMATVYNTFAGGGVRADTHVVKDVLNSSGHSILRPSPNAKKVLDGHIVRDTTYALEQVIKSGTGRRTAQLADNRPAAGKTGTVQEYAAAWFCGYTPQISSCVSVFRGDALFDGEHPKAGHSLAGLLNGRGVYGADWPAQIWKAFMDGAHRGLEIKQFEAPTYEGEIQTFTPSPTPTPTDLPTTPASDGLLPGQPGYTFDPADPFGWNRNRNNNGGNGGNGGTASPSPSPAPSPTPERPGGILDNLPGTDDD